MAGRGGYYIPGYLGQWSKCDGDGGDDDSGSHDVVFLCTRWRVFVEPMIHGMYAGYISLSNNGHGYLRLGISQTRENMKRAAIEELRKELIAVVAECDRLLKD